MLLLSTFTVLLLCLTFQSRSNSVLAQQQQEAPDDYLIVPATSGSNENFSSREAPVALQVGDVIHMDLDTTIITSNTNDDNFNTQREMQEEEDETTAAVPEKCVEFQESHSFEGLPLTLYYTLNYNEEASSINTFSGQVVYEGQGWVGFGFSPDGKMIGSTGIIGLPDEPQSSDSNNPGVYNLGGHSRSSVTLMEDQTLLSDASIEQNDTHTVLTFTWLLTEESTTGGGVVAINPVGSNYVLVAAGRGTLGHHDIRGSARLDLSPCNSAGSSNEESGSKAARDYYFMSSFLVTLVAGATIIGISSLFY